MNVSEKWVLENALHNDIDVIENVFFPQFCDELTERVAPAAIGYQTPVYCQKPVTFEEWKAKHYQVLRKYPSLDEQLDYIYHNGIEAWKNNMIKPVKIAFPKAEGCPRVEKRVR